MIFNDIDKTQPYTVMMVTEPVRLACLSFAGLARGVYYIQGDFRTKIAKIHDRRLLEAGLVALRFISDTEKPPEFAAPAEKPVSAPAPASKYEEQTPVAVMDAEKAMGPGGSVGVVEISADAVSAGGDPSVNTEEPKKKRRGRPPKVVAQAAAASKIDSYDEDSSNTDPSSQSEPAATEAPQNSSVPEDSPALA